MLLCGVLCVPAHAKNAPKAAAAKKATKKKAPDKKTNAEKIAASWEEFCTLWMSKLATREHDNIAKIHWETGSDGIKGTYVGYSKEHTCVLTESTQKVPVGKIAYTELDYEMRGATIPEAQQSVPRPSASYEVTEIFSYIKGKWDY